MPQKKRGESELLDKVGKQYAICSGTGSLDVLDDFPGCLGLPIKIYQDNQGILPPLKMGPPRDCRWCEKQTNTHN